MTAEPAVTGVDPAAASNSNIATEGKSMISFLAALCCACALLVTPVLAQNVLAVVVSKRISSPIQSLVNDRAGLV
jgi:hypothetical protein